MLTAVTGTVFAAAPGSGRFAEARGVLNRAEPFDTDAGAGAVADDGEDEQHLAGHEVHREVGEDEHLLGLLVGDRGGT